MKIVVLAGGTSTERSVSITSGTMVCKALREKNHQAVLVDVFCGIDVKGNLEDVFAEEAYDIDKAAEYMHSFDAGLNEMIASRRRFFGPNVLELCEAADVVFLALHGANGEDGKVQATFDLLGIPYTGTGYLSSALAMDKSITKQFFRAHHVPTPNGVTLKKGQESEPLSGFGLELPVVVKPCCGGSSADVLPAPLEGQAEADAIAGLSDPENETARSELIEHNLRLVVYIAQKFDNTGVGVEDLISIGTIGLIKAINTFNPEKKIKLATYASRCIENEILMYLRRNNKTRMEVSIDEPLNVDWDGNELLLSDILGTEEDVIYQGLEQEAEHRVLGSAISKLSEREQVIVKLRFGINMPEGREKTQKEVADLLGISQSYISRLEKRIMKRLRKEIARYE